MSHFPWLRLCLAGLVLLLLGGTSACDKLPINGTLDGRWQLLSMTDYTVPTAQVTSVQQERIYWSVQLHLLSLINLTKPISSVPYVTTEALARFVQTPDSLFLTETYLHYRAADSLLTDPKTQILKPLGVLGNRASYRIVQLDRQTLILQDNFVRLHFRRF